MTWSWLLPIALLTLGGCSGATQSERASTPTEPPAAAGPPAAVFGTWGHGQDRLYLGDDGTYMWEREQTCGVPPCPIDQTSGSFEVAGGSLRLATVAGPDLVLAYELGSDPRRVTLRHPDGSAWTLPFVE